MKNRLDRIVTKSGDSGLTSINPNKRISKNSNIVKFLGDLDELNAYIGTLKADLSSSRPKRRSSSRSNNNMSTPIQTPPSMTRSGSLF